MSKSEFERRFQFKTIKLRDLLKAWLIAEKFQNILDQVKYFRSNLNINSQILTLFSKIQIFANTRRPRFLDPVLNREMKNELLPLDFTIKKNNMAKVNFLISRFIPGTKNGVFR